MQTEKSTSELQEQDPGQIRRHVRLDLAGDSPPEQTIEAGVEAETHRPGMGVSPQVYTGANRGIFLLSRSGVPAMETPVFAAGPSNEEEAVVAFTNREFGILYLQVTRWTDHELREVAALQFGGLVRQMKDEGISAILVNANRRDQERGISQQPILPLAELRDLAGENLYAELMDRAR